MHPLTSIRFKTAGGQILMFELCRNNALAGFGLLSRLRPACASFHKFSSSSNLIYHRFAAPLAAVIHSIKFDQGPFAACLVKCVAALLVYLFCLKVPQFT